MMRKKVNEQKLANFHGIKIYGSYVKARKKGKDTCYIKIVHEENWKRNSIFSFVSGMWARFKR